MKIVITITTLLICAILGFSVYLKSPAGRKWRIRRLSARIAKLDHKISRASGTSAISYAPSNESVSDLKETKIYLEQELSKLHL